MYRITEVKIEAGFKLGLTYSNGRTVQIDLGAKIKKGGVFTSLADPQVFSEVKIGRAGRCLQWPGEIDLCADALWFEATGELFSAANSKAS